MTVRGNDTILEITVRTDTEEKSDLLGICKRQNDEGDTKILSRENHVHANTLDDIAFTGVIKTSHETNCNNGNKQQVQDDYLWFKSNKETIMISDAPKRLYDHKNW